MTWRNILDLIFPAQCAACNAIGSGVCAACAPSATPIDIRLRLLRVRALGVYEDALRAAVLALKDGRRDVAESLGELLAPHVGSGVTLVPVPTTAARRRARGIDGVALMTHVAGRLAGVEVVEALHQCAGDAQRGRSRGERLRARHRFECRAFPSGARRVVLIDDVCTTGTTLEDCADAVTAAGGFVQRALVVAAAKPGRGYF